jgi:heme-degrading monooxygenase HmoA
MGLCRVLFPIFDFPPTLYTVIDWYPKKECVMTISIVIQRTFKSEQIAANLAPLIVKLRSLATIQPGYITGKTFRCLDCPGEYLVISTWNSLDDWNRWLESEERMDLQKKVDDLLGEKTQYRMYEPLVGGIIPKFKGVVG